MQLRQNLVQRQVDAPPFREQLLEHRRPLVRQAIEALVALALFPPLTQQQPLGFEPPQQGIERAFIDIQAVASNSAEGKAATAKLDELRKKKNSELLAKQTSLKAMQDKLNAGGSVMSDQARGQLEKDIEKASRDLQFAQQDAQTEVTDMTNQLQGDFQEKLNPVIEQLRTDKGLLMIFSIRDSGVVSAEPGLDLSSEVIKRFDAANKPAPKK